LSVFRAASPGGCRHGGRFDLRTCPLQPSRSLPVPVRTRPKTTDFLTGPMVGHQRTAGLAGFSPDALTGQPR
jgi:hypothetical protein